MKEVSGLRLLAPWESIHALACAAAHCRINTHPAELDDTPHVLTDGTPHANSA